jgi:hypothetical protein
MPVLDIAKLTKAQKTGLEKAFIRLSKREILPVEKEIKMRDHQNLNRVIFDILGCSKTKIQEIYSALKELVKYRYTKANSVNRNGKNKKYEKNQPNNYCGDEQQSLLTLL